jgi:catechol 2,3-dioxygenase-like lactoylglutathione lyase family enzyme
MPHPVIHAEIRSEDPDATRKFYADLFEWKVASEGGFPGYTFIDTGVEGGTFVAISPRQGPERLASPTCRFHAGSQRELADRRGLPRRPYPKDECGDLPDLSTTECREEAVGAWTRATSPLVQSHDALCFVRA